MAKTLIWRDIVILTRSGATGRGLILPVITVSLASCVPEARVRAPQLTAIDQAYSSSRNDGLWGRPCATKLSKVAFPSVY